MVAYVVYRGFKALVILPFTEKSVEESGLS
jgi:hypothetical protein